MKKIIFSLLLALPGVGMASGGSHTAYSFKPDLGNEASLQRGASAYMSYCAGCHSLKYLRYNRIAQDLGIPEDLVMKYLASPGDKPGDTITVAMPAAASAQWFGRSPPDLSLTARSRGPSWIYSYLMTFYLDPSRPTGVNNLTLPGASMPHVLGELQGWQKLAEAKPHGDEGGHGEAAPLFEMVRPGTMEAGEYKVLVQDLTNFLEYAAEPVKLVRYGLGVKVILFLLVFTGLAYALKREFWKDVH